MRDEQPAPTPAVTNLRPGAHYARVLLPPRRRAPALRRTGYAQSSDPAPHVDQWGTCRLDGASVSVYQFADDDVYQAFLKASAAHGVTEAWLVRSGNVVVAPTDQTQLPAIRAALGK